jgi:hypothetical protein
VGGADAPTPSELGREREALSTNMIDSPTYALARWSRETEVAMEIRMATGVYSSLGFDPLLCLYVFLFYSEPVPVHPQEIK